MTYSDCAGRWQKSGGAERANDGLFLRDLCDLIGLPKPDHTTDNLEQMQKLCAAQPLTPKDQTVNQQGLASLVLSLPQQLDAAVADAYTWSAALPDAEMLTRHVHLP